MRTSRSLLLIAAVCAVALFASVATADEWGGKHEGREPVKYHGESHEHDGRRPYHDDDDDDKHGRRRSYGHEGYDRDRKYDGVRKEGEGYEEHHGRYNKERGEERRYGEGEKRSSYKRTERWGRKLLGGDWHEDHDDHRHQHKSKEGKRYPERRNEYHERERENNHHKSREHGERREERHGKEYPRHW